MFAVKSFARERPLLTFVLLCFGITWPVWFCVPLIAGHDWALGKIVTGAGFGPALAAIVMDYWRGTGADVRTVKWWVCFGIVFLIVGAIDVSTLITGDGITASAFAAAKAPGLSPVGLIAAAIASTVAGFIVACVACSRSRTLNSLLSWRQPLRWWAVALFLPSVWMLSGIAMTHAAGGHIESVLGSDLRVWAMFILRSVLFTLLVVAVGEESGWRGFMLPELQKRFSPLLSSVIIGAVWGLWHFPLFVNGQYPGTEPVMVFAKMGACALLAIFFTWLYNRSGGVLLLAVVLHTALNNTPRLLPTTERMGVVFLGICALFVLVDRMWRKRPVSQFA